MRHAGTVTGGPGNPTASATVTFTVAHASVAPWLSMPALLRGTHWKVDHRRPGFVIVSSVILTKVILHSIYGHPLVMALLSAGIGRLRKRRLDDACDWWRVSMCMPFVTVVWEL